MNPKYSVGEVIILQSRSLPEYNGEYVVQNIYKPGEKKMCQAGSNIAITDPYRFTYDLGFSFEWRGAVISTFQEVALRKKHEPSQMSFQSLIQGINNPVKQES